MFQINSVPEYPEETHINTARKVNQTHYIEQILTVVPWTHVAVRNILHQHSFCDCNKLFDILYNSHNSFTIFSHFIN